MLWTILMVLLVLWLLGFIGGIGGGLIHLLLAVALVILILQLITGRRAAVGRCANQMFSGGLRPSDWAGLSPHLNDGEVICDTKANSKVKLNKLKAAPNRQLAS